MSGKLNVKRTILVGFAFFLISAFWQSYDKIVPLILTQRFGMNQTLSGFIMSLDNVFAVFMLPIFGALSDKVSTKHGRRTPFILLGTVCAVVFYVFLSLAPSLWLFILLLLATLIIASIATFVTGLMKYSELQREKEALEQKVEEYEAEVEKLEYLIDCPVDYDYIVRIAKEKLNLYLPDEIIYHNDSNK